MFWILRNWRRRRIVRGADVSDQVWGDAWSLLPILGGLDADESRRLRELAAVFLAEKSLEPVQGMVLNDSMKRIIALQACLPVLNLGFDWLDALVSVVVYPETFLAEVTEHDEAGIVHNYREARSGESWDRGPMLLSWADVEEDAGLDGYNVILHEVAHKIDALGGTANGMPPMRSRAAARQWSRVFNAAYAEFNHRVDAGEETPIDPYAGESPAEFFAVFSEGFFEIPNVVHDAWPAIYAELAGFYRQDPLARFARPRRVPT